MGSKITTKCKKIKVLLTDVDGVLTDGGMYYSNKGDVMKKFYEQTVLFMVGLLAASLYVIWPFQNRTYNIVHAKEMLISSSPYIPELVNRDAFYSISMMVFGVFMVIILSRFSKQSVTI